MFTLPLRFQSRHSMLETPLTETSLTDELTFAEEQDKDKYCKIARDKYEKACKKQEELQDSLEIVRQPSLDERI